jgi:hypothetical protein
MDARMIALSSPEESARAIIAIFKVHGTQVGGFLMSGALAILFARAGYDTRDFADGLQYAVDRGWLELGPFGKIRLTGRGFATF